MYRALILIALLSLPGRLCAADSCRRAPQTFDDLRRSIANLHMEKHVLQCGIGAVSGAFDATFGLLVAAAQILRIVPVNENATSLMQDFEAAQKNARIESNQKRLSWIDKTAIFSSTSKTYFEKMPPEQRTKAICQAAAWVGVNAFEWVGTGGADAAGDAAAVALKTGAVQAAKQGGKRASLIKILAVMHRAKELDAKAAGKLGMLLAQ